jgi:hypothetical protein
VFTRGDNDEEEFSEDLADLVHQISKIPNREQRDQLVAIFTRPSLTTGIFYYF